MRSSGEQRGRRTKTVGSGVERRGRHPIIGRTAGSTYEDDEIMVRTAGPTPPSAPRSHRLRAPAPLFARGSDDDPAVRAMIGRRPRCSHHDFIVFVRRPRCSPDDRTPAPPFDPGPHRAMIVRWPCRSRDELIVFVRRPRWSRGDRTSAPSFAPSSHRLRAPAPLVARSSCADPAVSPRISSSACAGPAVRPMIGRRPRWSTDDLIIFARRPRCSTDDRTPAPLSLPRSHRFRASTRLSAPDRVRPRRPSRSPPHRAPAPPLALLAFAVREGAITARRGRLYDPSTRYPSALTSNGTHPLPTPSPNPASRLPLPLQTPLRSIGEPHPRAGAPRVRRIAPNGRR